MFWFVSALVFLLVALLIAAFAPSALPRYSPGAKPINAKKFAFAPLILALLLMIPAMCTTVAPKQVGVVSTFGKVSQQTLSSGPHLKWPWQKVVEIDATIQTDEYRGDDCITVVLADKNTACVSVTNRWAVNEEKAGTTYADFRSDDPTKSLRDAVVSTQLKAAVNDTFGTYDATQEEKPDYDGMSVQIAEKLKGATEGLVDIESVTISYIKPSEKLQSKIESIQAQASQTTIAEEKIKTAEKEAEANRILSDSISNDPNVLVSKCLDMVAELPAGTLPPGFQCWNGAGSSLVIPGVK